MRRIAILTFLLVFVGCGSKGEGGEQAVLDEAVIMGANTAANRIVSLVKPSENTGGA